MRSRAFSQRDAESTPPRLTSLLPWGRVTSLVEPRDLHESTVTNLSQLDLMWTIVGAILTTIAILTGLYGIYYLMAPYLGAIVWAIVVSIVLHPQHTVTHAKVIARYMNEALIKSPRMGWVIAFGWLLLSMTNTVSVIFGFAVIMERWVGASKIIFLTDFLWTCGLCYILCTSLGLIAVVVLSVTLGVILITHVGHILFGNRSSTITFVRRVNAAFVIIVISLTALWIGWQLTLEALKFLELVRDQASVLNTALEPYMSSILPHIRAKVEEVASSYNLHKHAKLLQDTVNTLTKDFGATTWEQKYESMQLFYNNITLAQWGPQVLEHVQKYALAGGMSVVDVLLRIIVVVVEFAVGSLGFLYEIVLFFLTWSYLHSQKKTILYYAFLKIRFFTTGNTGESDKDNDKVQQYERNVRDRFWGLATSLLHVGVYHWGCTYIAVYLVEFPFPMSASICGALIALFPYIPKYFVATAPALITSYLQGRFQSTMVSLSWLIFCWLLGDDFLLKIRDIPTFVTAVSMVLGLTTFGLKGVIVGPVLAMGIFSLWEASGGKLNLEEPTKTSSYTSSSHNPVTGSAKKHQ